ncbi:MAG: hypothetical protein V4660_00675 [Pseudomonadota bacterium]
MSQLTFKKFIKNNKHLLILQPTLALALLVAAHQTFAEKDLFSNEPGPQHPLPAQEMIDPPEEEDDTLEPTLSPTDAALRAQRHVDGKVMNVRRFAEENKTLYGVKLLQKNGRIKTVTVDANSGAILE